MPGQESREDEIQKEVNLKDHLWEMLLVDVNGHGQCHGTAPVEQAYKSSLFGSLAVWTGSSLRSTNLALF